VVYRELGRYPETIKFLKQAISINPNYADAYSNLGLVYFRIGRNFEAIAALKQATRINPNHAKAHYSLGLTYLILDNRDSALEEYNILKDLDRKLANSLFDLIYDEGE